MGTLLVTPKMAPELAARVERSVGVSRRRFPGRGFGELRRALLRFGLLLVVVAGVYSAVAGHYRRRRAIETRRAALLAIVRTQQAALTPEVTSFLPRVESWLLGLAGAYEGDLRDADLRDRPAFAAALGRPAVYVRGPLGAFTREGGIAKAAAASGKDAFLLCLLDPPASRAESAVLARVRAAYAGGALLVQRTENVRRLDDAIAGTEQLLSPWAERVRAAKEPEELAAIGRELAQVPVEATRRAANAELLIAVMDEEGEPGPAELDGERAHPVRALVVDLVARRALARRRERVDPSTLSAGVRASYAAGVDGCALAFDLVRPDAEN